MGEIPPAAKEKKQWLKTIKKLQATLSHGEPKVGMRGESRVATQGQARVDGGSTTSSSPTCPRTLRTTPRAHQRKTRRNTPVTQHVAIEPAQHGEGLRQTQIYMRSDKAEPGDSLTAEPVPARTATEPQRSSRIRPQAPLTARDKRAKTRTVNRQIIGSKRNSVKHASRRRIASLVDTQLNIDKTTPPPTKTRGATADERRKTRTEPVFTYHVPCPKNKRTPAPVTQEETERQPTAAAATKNTTWKLDGSNYGKTNINPPLAGISRGALNQFMGNAFLEELKRTAISADPTTLEEVANDVVHPVTKETITKYKKLIEDPMLRETWSKAMCKELGRLCQGFGETKGTDTMRFLDLEDIKNIPKDRVVTYARIVVPM